jgi:DNA ligase (NAD+)
MNEPIGKSEQKLVGKKFVFTGEMSSLSRHEASEQVRKMGGEVSSSVSKNTDFVVAGESPGSKYQKALKLGVKVINEEQFTSLMSRSK